MCRTNADNQLVMATLDEETQKQAVMLNQEKTSKVAHLVKLEFVCWLIEMANKGKWSKEDIASIVCKKDRENQLVLARLDIETQKQVAVYNKAKTCQVVPYMDEGDFLSWLYQEAVDGRWYQVLAALAREEVDGKAVIVSRRKKGTSFINIRDA